MQKLPVDTSRVGEFVFMGVAEKTKLAKDAQGNTTKDRVRDIDNASKLPKWTIRVAVEVEAYGEMTQEMMNVTLISRENPAQGLKMGRIVQFANLWAGTLRDGGLYFWADAVSLVGAPAPAANNGRA